jgi:hypothetical protein
MATIHKKKRSNVDLVLEDAQTTTAHGGVIAIDALAKDFGLWEKIKGHKSMDQRRDTKRGFSPEVIVAQLILSLCSGGISLADAERFGKDSALGKLLGLEKMADESTLGEWLRGQDRHSLSELWALNHDLVQWILERSEPARVRHGGQLEVFFDDTQIEVSGKCFEGAAKNYEGNLSYSWQTLWVGPFVGQAYLMSGNTSASACLKDCLGATEKLWKKASQEGKAHFYADSASSSGEHINQIDQIGWNWTVSYNKWLDKLDVLSSQLPPTDWSKSFEITGRNGQPMIEQYGWVKHTPGTTERTQLFAVARFKSLDEGDLFWRYAYVVGGCTNGQWKEHIPEDARRVFERHHLKGAKEQGFHQLLSDLDLHHPPCKDQLANEFYYALTSLAFNLLMGLKVLHLDDDKQAWTVRTLIRYWLTVPVKLSQHAHRTRARIFVPKAALRWWRIFIQEKLPPRSPGRPPRDPQIVIQS